MKAEVQGKEGNPEDNTLNGAGLSTSTRNKL
jgi:hypothetical protein